MHTNIKNSINSLLARVMMLQDENIQHSSFPALIAGAKKISNEINNPNYLVVSKFETYLTFKTNRGYSGTEPFASEDEFETKLDYLKDLFSIGEENFEIIE